ncbi:SNARE associated Golgi protein-like protein [Thermovibrio ammonificans HB-1]|uniref:SNARE associated Golgi protein-like protein n=1 Tax=Thermovibrio ammonificans (strain DSM 15698 / JCM 12110 / HB-1) TaxID=648996 RepID=E8T569_THEA1|nr:DedA family protein [Thermovibrio ammonificans]ADU96407.1 SNARE associated Golgi protein-like protein [Thermovibrio ammonificans HB-1]
MDLSSLYSLVNESVNFIKAHPDLACLVIFTWAFLETALLLGLLLPAEKVLLLSSLLAAKGIISPLQFLVCGTVGTFLGYTVSYFFGAMLGEELLTSVAAKFGLSEESLKKTKRFIETRGELSLVVGRFLPVVRPLLPVVIGAFRPSFLKFSLLNAVGALLWILSYLLFGNLIGYLFSFIISHKFVAIPVILLVPTLYLIWRRYGKNSRHLL